MRQYYGNEHSQFVDFRRPAQGTARTLVINIHGGFWRVRYDLQHAEPLCEALAAAGFATANIEYRRVGELGHSAGGHLALWVAAEIRDLTAVIGLAPVASLHQTLSDNAVAGLMGGTPTQFPDRYAYADPARPTPVPRVIIHGTADDIVPISLSRDYGAPARLVEIPGADHFAVIDPLHAAWHTVLQEVTAVL